jgi:hypothetical protein
VTNYLQISRLEAGEGRPFLQQSPEGVEKLQLCNSSQNSETRDPSPEIPEVEGSADISKAIPCSGQAPFEGGVEDFRKYPEGCKDVSKSAGATMANMRLECVE